jgi:hypothetical protein
MARKRHTAEQVVILLRQVEVAVANGNTTTQASKEAEITEQTYYRWRKEYGGVQVDQAKRLKELEQESRLPLHEGLTPWRTSSNCGRLLKETFGPDDPNEQLDP